MTEERKAILKEKYSKWYLVSAEQGVGLCEALEQAGRSAYVYERLGKSTAVEIDHNDRMLAALKAVVAWMTRGERSRSVEVAGIDVTGLIAEVEAYNSAQAELIARYEV